MNEFIAQQFLLPMHAPHSDLPDQSVNAVIEGFRASNYAQLRAIDVEEAHGGILLRGRVRTFFLKQMAYITAANAAGGAPIRDEIVVSL